MKTLKNLVVLVLIATTVSLTSCSKDDDAALLAIPSLNTGGEVKADVDGTDFTSMSTASTATQTGSAPNSSLRLQGSDADGKAVVILINGYDGTGTYEFSSVALTNATYTETDVNNPQNSQSWSDPNDSSNAPGSVTVEEDANGRVKGTFSFIGKNSDDQSFKTISDGEFDLAKQTF